MKCFLVCVLVLCCCCFWNARATEVLESTRHWTAACQRDRWCQQWISLHHLDSLHSLVTFAQSSPDANWTIDDYRLALHDMMQTHDVLSACRGIGEHIVFDTATGRSRCVCNQVHGCPPYGDVVAAGIISIGQTTYASDTPLGVVVLAAVLGFFLIIYQLYNTSSLNKETPLVLSN